MHKDDFAGLNGFVWWVGVIENRIDPLAIGRCQVRILGWHSQDKNEVPTSKLPWSYPIYPINNSKEFSAPRVGDWVLGFFFDGKNGQQPVMFGVMPGIIP